MITNNDIEKLLRKGKYVASVRYDDFFKMSLMVGAAMSGFEELGIRTEADQIITFAGMYLFENFKSELEDAYRFMKQLQAPRHHNNLQPLVEKLQHLREGSDDEQRTAGIQVHGSAADTDDGN